MDDELDDEPQPGLLPIIPRFRLFGDGPSPLIPVIILVIVVTLRWVFLSMLDFFSSFETEVPDMDLMIDSFQSHLTITFLLVPVVLLLAIFAFGFPQVRNAPQDSPFVKAIIENFWSSVLLLVVIMALLWSIPTQSISHSPWQQPEFLPPVPIYARPRYGSGRGGYAINGICQELGILKRRCENWKGNSRDTVCRELAKLQKRCEKGRF